MKDAYYFSHDYNSRNDQKILVLRSVYQSKGYGVFWMLIEIMAESTLPHIAHAHIPAIAVSINEDSIWLNEFVEYCINEARLFTSDGLVFTSMRIIKHKQMRELFSESGRVGADRRWHNIAPPISPPIREGYAKERKGKEIKGNKETPRFAPPDLQTAISFFLENKSTQDQAESFHNYFASKGWVVGRGSPMKDWGAAAKNWIKRSADFSPKQIDTQAADLLARVKKR